MEEAINLEEPVADEEMREIEEDIQRSNRIRLMAYGVTGTGKSALLNAIIGEPIFEEGDDFDAQTRNVEEKHCLKAGVDVYAYDTPGLEDYSGNEQRYLDDIRRNCTDIDLFMYCINMTQMRIPETEDRNSPIHSITRSLGLEIWAYSMIVLTFANIFEKSLVESHGRNKLDSLFKRKVKQWEEYVKKTLNKLGVPKKSVWEIKITTAGFRTNIHLQTEKYWLTNLWTVALTSMKEDAQAAMVRIAYTRFREESDVRVEDLRADTACHPLVFSKSDLATGAGVGGGTTGVAGAIALGAVGATIGSLLIGIPSFGVFAGLGMALGGVAGAAAGAQTGAAAGIMITLYRRKKKIEKFKHDIVTKLAEQISS